MVKKVSKNSSRKKSVKTIKVSKIKHASSKKKITNKNVNTPVVVQQENSKNNNKVLSNNSVNESTLKINIQASNISKLEPVQTDSSTPQGVPSIYADDPVVPIAQKPDSKFKFDLFRNIRVQASRPIIRLILKIVLGLIILLFVLILLSSIEFGSDEVVEKTVTRTISTVENVSFEKYVGITDRYYVESVSLLGYLREESIIRDPLTVHNKYIVDDYNREIPLSIKYKDESLFNKHFIPDTTTDNTFNVTGVFKYVNEEFLIVVNNITLQKKPVLIRTITEVVNVTSEDVNIRINVSNGINKLI